MSDEVKWRNRVRALRSDVERYEEMQRAFRQAGDEEAFRRAGNCAASARNLLSLCEDRFLSVVNEAQS